MDSQIRRRLNMSDNRGKYPCACRTKGIWGSHPEPSCPHCDGTGYTNDLNQKKDWTKNPPSETDW